MPLTVEGEGKIIPGCELRNKLNQYIIANGIWKP